jgi:hypothetical protein
MRRESAHSPKYRFAALGFMLVLTVGCSRHGVAPDVEAPKGDLWYLDITVLRTGTHRDDDLVIDCWVGVRLALRSGGDWVVPIVEGVRNGVPYYSAFGHTPPANQPAPLRAVVLFCERIGAYEKVPRVSRQEDRRGRIWVITFDDVVILTEEGPLGNWKEVDPDEIRAKLPTEERCVITGTRPPVPCPPSPAND